MDNVFQLFLYKKPISWWWDHHCNSLQTIHHDTRADSVCTKCGTVCESGISVSDVQFEENAHGGSSALGKTKSGLKIFVVITLLHSHLDRNLCICGQEGGRHLLRRNFSHNHRTRVERGESGLWLVNTLYLTCHPGDSEECQKEDSGSGPAAPPAAW